MKAIIICLFAIGFINQAVAQTPDARPCPTIILDGPADNKIAEGKEAVFTVRPLDKVYSDLSLTYTWSLNNGTIISGQGTSSITVNTKGLREQIVTISVELGGMKAGCVNYKSINVDVVAAGGK